MVTITFPDTKTRHEAIGFLAGRFNARVLGTGEVIVPESALEALALENLTFTVRGKATYEQMAPVRGPVSPAVQ